MTQVSPFFKTADLIEAKATGNRVRVLIRASTPAVDKQGERFLPEAWINPEDRAHFLKAGNIDYNHLSRLLQAKYKGAAPLVVQESERARAKAIIGEPRALETEGETLLCEADLYRNNGYVQDILPALEADSTRFGASVAGFAFPPTEITKSQYGAGVFDRARLDHIAICPLREAINEETAITLIKSAMTDAFDSPVIEQRPDQDEQETQQVSPLISSAAGFDDALVHDYATSQPGFREFLYQRLKSTLAKDLDYEKALEFFQKCGFDASESKTLATRALIHFGSMPQ